jgi:hypothetical protein
MSGNASYCPFSAAFSVCVPRRGQRRLDPCWCTLRLPAGPHGVPSVAWHHPEYRSLARVRSLPGVSGGHAWPRRGSRPPRSRARISRPGGPDQGAVHHEERLETMQRAIEGGSKVPYEVSRVVFRGTLALEAGRGGKSTMPSPSRQHSSRALQQASFSLADWPAVRIAGPRCRRPVGPRRGLELRRLPRRARERSGRGSVPALPRSGG